MIILMRTTSVRENIHHPYTETTHNNKTTVDQQRASKLYSKLQNETSQKALTIAIPHLRVPTLTMAVT